MTMTNSIEAIDAGLVPSARSLWNLALAGFAATGFYEIWANWPTALLAGFPLEPPALIKSLFQHQLAVTVPDVWAKALHFLTGFLFYPLGYWLLTRIRSFGHPTDGWIWGVITYFIALGFFAPLAGRPFLLIGDNNLLSLMSLIGHAIFGFVLATVFQALQAQRG
ncbi:hypothetical protein [Bosea psychrotolerans]|uniref:DUF1440 domain-containing protein n=1 Tax=Bosea psychrotolerans TaxID=1871628 RepID=A0A2S4M818_9HYPH|nr:hypothetical protein [Bosea psychrotolerans]POR50811.1 hypothetical protein CYD53_10859 [Bosea psychrotolerans]